MATLLRSYAFVLAGASLMSLGGVGIKLCGAGPWTLGGLRGGVAALALWLLLPEARRHWSWRCVPTGLALAATMVCFVWANKTTTAASTIFLQSTAPLWILLLSPLLLREVPARRDMALTALFAVGMMLIFLDPEPVTRLSPRVVAGNWVALAAGLTYGMAIMGLRALRGRGAEAALVLGNLMALVVSLPMMAAEGALASGRARDWLIIAALGTVQIGLAYALYARGLRRVTALRGSLIGLVEPILNPVWVFLVWQEERPGATAILGGAIIVGATCLQIVAGARPETPEGR